MPLYTIDTLPTTSQEAIREFQDRYIAAQGVVQPQDWVAEFGDSFDVNSPKVTFPISQVGGTYQETKGNSRFKTMSEESFDVKVVEYDMGYEANLMDLYLNTYSVRKWNQQAELFTKGEIRHCQKQVATILELGTATTIWDTANFFSATHPANHSDSGAGTFSNYQSGAKDPNSIPNIMAEIALMRGVKDENGDKLDVNPNVIMLPTAKFDIVNALLLQQNVTVASGTGSPGGGTATMSNPLMGLRAVHNPFLTDANDWYLIDTNLVRQLPPWAAMRFAAPDTLGLRTWDESSDFFKDTGKIKVSSHIWYGFGLVFPHAIRLVTGA